jgi:hypothetical protein
MPAGEEGADDNEKVMQFQVLYLLHRTSLFVITLAGHAAEDNEVWTDSLFQTKKVFTKRDE